MDCSSCSAIFGNTWCAILGEMMVNLVMKRRDAWGIHQPAPMIKKDMKRNIAWLLFVAFLQAPRVDCMWMCGTQQGEKQLKTPGTGTGTADVDATVLELIVNFYFQNNSPEMVS